MRWLACWSLICANSAICRYGYSLSRDAPKWRRSPIRCRRWRLLWPCLRAGLCDVGCAPASALTAPEASPVAAPPRVLGGFAGNGRRFRHGSWTSGRFLAGAIRCQLLRPGETPTLGGVSGRFGLRNRPEVASGVRLRRRWRILICAPVQLVLVAGIVIAEPCALMLRVRVGGWRGVREMRGRSLPGCCAPRCATP